MCLLAFAALAHPAYPFILVHNRDELFNRATTPPVPEPNDGIVCGTDSVAGGTWLGLNTKTGMLVAMTNIRHVDFPASSPDATTSRGLLVRQWLTNPTGNTPTPDQDHPLPGKFNGFNMILCNLFSSSPQPILFSNGPQPVQCPTSVSYSVATGHAYTLHAGVHALSNSFLDDPTWPKVNSVSQRLTDILSQTPVSHSHGDGDGDGPDALAMKLLDMMSDSSEIHHSVMPDVSFSTDPPAMERHNQRIFQPADHVSAEFTVDFGTRAQTVVIRTRDCVHYYYRDTDKWPAVSQTIHITVPLPPQPSAVKRAVILVSAVVFGALGLIFGKK